MGMYLFNEHALQDVIPVVAFVERRKGGRKTIKKGRHA
jgi:hypothetical protein